MASGLRVALAALLCAGLLSCGSKEDVRVVDGDTLAIDGTKWRLHGVDAPEASQVCARAGGGDWPCGARATAALEKMVDGETVACALLDTDRYGRSVGQCVAGGQDLGRAMVRQGMAWAYLRYSQDYAAEEAGARSRGDGVWQAPTEAPWDYRAHRHTGGSGAAAAAPSAETAARTTRRACPIKGNISAAGRIYHVPGSRWYARTSIDENAGERWFCSPEEAEAAGWRAPE
ncbi:thermonuclease family protein [Paroceanicella profunda]|uniref:Thermonuclease family protein n=1 Tax=Paroceanicella profunda TaxID=2579971 RepID=A0A5B8FWW2_9RHOB|nr:thermonuclease family protein [Paroceanicella profunda]QDL92054.1 thermonuclease family protein [Paroceanicella profunda]